MALSDKNDYYCGELGHPAGARKTRCDVCGKMRMTLVGKLNPNIQKAENNAARLHARKNVLAPESDAFEDLFSGESNKETPPPKHFPLSDPDTTQKTAPASAPVKAPASVSSDFLKNVAQEAKLPDARKADVQEGKAASTIISNILAASSIQNVSDTDKPAAPASDYNCNADGYYNDVFGSFVPKPDKFSFHTFIKCSLIAIGFILLQIYFVYFLYW